MRHGFLYDERIQDLLDAHFCVSLSLRSLDLHSTHIVGLWMFSSRDRISLSFVWLNKTTTSTIDPTMPAHRIYIDVRVNMHIYSETYIQSVSPLVCVAVCCNMLQCVEVCCSVLQQCVAACCRVLQCAVVRCRVLQCVAVCCSALQCVAVCYTLQCIIHVAVL